MTIFWKVKFLFWKVTDLLEGEISLLGGDDLLGSEISLLESDRSFGR